MTTSTPGPPGPEADEELRASLGALLRTAHENGVDVEGGWALRNGPDLPDWGVEVYEVEKPRKTG